MTGLLDRLSAGWRPHALIALWLIACALPGLIAVQPLDRDESRFAQATTQMFESGDFIRISFQDEPRNKKPVGIHWMQAATVSIGGGPDTRLIQLYRVPSLLGALLAALATFSIAARLFTRREGLLAGAALGTCLLLSTEAGIAKTDAMLCGLTVLAFAGLAALRHPVGHTRGGAGLFWVALAIAVMVKGPVAVMVIAPALLLLAVWERDVRWMAPLLDWRWIGLAAVIAVPWHVAIWIATDGRFFVDAIGQDLAPKVAGQHENDPVLPGAHLLFALVNLWPWGFLIASGVWAAWHWRTDRRGRFLVAWLVPGWLVFEAAPAKLLHYTLPVLPALVILGVAGIMGGAWRNRWAKWTGLALALAGSVVVAAIPLAGALELQPESVTTATVLAAVLLVFSLAGLVLASADRWRGAVAALLVSGLVFAVGLKGWFVPSLASLQVSMRVAAPAPLAGPAGTAGGCRLPGAEPDLPDPLRLPVGFAAARCYRSARRVRGGGRAGARCGSGEGLAGPRTCCVVAAGADRRAQLFQGRSGGDLGGPDRRVRASG
jgi:4-amino-4-deoxy-L-arabinose transferase-like glycosyltransferase